MVLLAYVGAISSAEAKAFDPPAFVYLTWARDDAAHSINISWRTVKEGYLGEVRYDTEPRGGDPELYRYRMVGDADITPVTYGGLKGYVHHVELTGLKPDTKYYFICGHPDYGWSEERAFRTAPASRTSFRFVVGGDSRSGGPDWPEARDNISRAMAKFDPSFVVFHGDFVNHWYDQREWDNWFAAANMFWVSTDGLTIPIVPAIGNHDVRVLDYDPLTDATNYYQQFSLPGNERWYALSWGPDLRIIVLDTEMTNASTAYREQLSWLENELKASKGYLWKVVVLHRDMVSSRGPDERMITDFAFLFDKYHVDLVFMGHFHGYERSHPLDWMRAPGEVMAPGKGVIYVVTAGWGAPLYGGEPKWFSAFGPESRYNFVVVDVFENGTLHLKAIDVKGNVFDQLVINKEVPAAFEVWVAVISAVGFVAAIGAAYFFRWGRRR